MKKFYVCFCGMVLILFFVSAGGALAGIPDNYFKGASIETNISCYDVVADAQHILKYDKVSLREDTDWMTAEWLDVSGLGSNSVKVSSSCTNSWGEVFPIQVTYTYDGVSKAVSKDYSFSANSSSLGTHTFTVNCVINGKTLIKTLIVNVVRTVQGTADIRYKTSGMIPQDIRLLSNQNTSILVISNPPILGVSNLMLTSSAKTTFNNLIPAAYKKGQECMVKGVGVITVYNIKTNTTLGVYRLDTKYNDLINDYSWSSGALQDFLSKKNFKVPYRNKISTNYKVSFYDVDSSAKITDDILGTIEYFGHQVEVYSCDLGPANTKGERIMNGIPYLFFFNLMYFDGKPPLSSSNSLTYVTLGIGGSYDETFSNKIDEGKEIEYRYYFRASQPTTTPAPTPRPTVAPTPSTGNVILSCISKKSSKLISSLVLQMNAGASRIFSPPMIDGYIHHPDDVNSINVNVLAGSTTYVNFYYAKIGAVTIEHRDQKTKELLSTDNISGVVLFEDVDLRLNSYQPGGIPGYVHESYTNSAINSYVDILLTEQNSNITVVLYYVKATCIVIYEVYDASKSLTAISRKVNLPASIVIPARIDQDGTENPKGLFQYSGNNYLPGIEPLLYLSEEDCNKTIILRFSMAIQLNSIIITGAYNHWGNNVKRFMCLEKIKVTCSAENVDKMVVRFSSQLEAMEFTSPSGIKYDYYDFFKKHVYFPSDSTAYFLNQKASWSYSLPLANETISWQNVVKKSSYFIDITLSRGTFSKTYRYDIDITGKVTDLIEPQ